jgi:hypothetical protein
MDEQAYRGQYGEGGCRFGSVISKRRAGAGSSATMRTRRWLPLVSSGFRGDCRVVLGDLLGCDVVTHQPGHGVVRHARPGDDRCAALVSGSTARCSRG